MIQAILAKVKSNFAILFGLSWLIVAFGQPARSSLLCPLAAVCGFALFWIGVRGIKTRRFWWASAWYFCVQLIQLSWLTSIEYQGYYILAVYVFLCACLGMQFGLITHFLFAEKKSCRAVHIVAVASLWTLMEWSRLFVLCGFSWNPVGLAMTGGVYPMQLANIWGIYGLSFWVILVNAALYFALISKRSLSQLVLCAVLAVVPYIYGFAFLHLNSAFSDHKPRLFSVGLVQTGLLPSQKVPLPGRSSEFIEPLDQWKRILSSLHDQDQKWDLLVFPEAVVPTRADFCFYPYDDVLNDLRETYGPNFSVRTPSLAPPFAQYRFSQNEQILCVSNAFFAQMIANVYDAEVVIGLDHYDPASRRNYNSAFHCIPESQQIRRYDKQVLLPLAEYLPFSWLRPLTKRYGITDFFSHGKESEVFGKNIPFSLSICYEETFPHLIRKGRIKGAELLVNVTNDNYYPFSQLPEQHFTHARVRAVENGVPLLRACNTGVTAVIDRFGRTVSRLGDGQKASETSQGVLNTSLPLESHKTIYMFWGDLGIVGLALISLLFFICKQPQEFALEENGSVS